MCPPINLRTFHHQEKSFVILRQNIYSRLNTFGQNIASFRHFRNIIGVSLQESEEFAIFHCHNGVYAINNGIAFVFQLIEQIATILTFFKCSPVTTDTYIHFLAKEIERNLLAHVAVNLMSNESSRSSMSKSACYHHTCGKSVAFSHFQDRLSRN